MYAEDVVLVYLFNLFSLQDPLYPNPGPVSNLSYDFVYLCAEFIMGVHGKKTMMLVTLMQHELN